MLKILDTGRAPAQANMDIDAALLRDLDDVPILHLYDWEGPSATHGHFIRPADYLDLDQVQKQKLNLGKRPTGGGIIFHVSDWAFSVLVPSKSSQYSLNTLDNYALVNRAVQDAVRSLIQTDLLPELLPHEPVPLDASCAQFCMAKPTKYDVMLGNQKIAGAAQRRMRQGFLHQGSICLALPSPELLEAVLLPGTQVLSAMQQNTFSLLGREANASELCDLRHQMRLSFVTALEKTFETEPVVR